MDKFIGKISEIINNNTELKNSIVLRSVLENIDYKSGSVDNLTLLNLIKEGLTDVNMYLNNNDITSIISSVNSKINETVKTDINGFIKRSSNEFDIVSLAESIKSSPEVNNNPKLSSYLSQFVVECKGNKYPSYLYLNPFASTLSMYNEYSVVKESIEKVNSYIKENTEKLVVLDTITYLESLGSNGLHNASVNTLKQCVFESQYNPDIIALKLGDTSKLGSISNMLDSLRSLRHEKAPQFDLGNGRNGTEVYNFVGPVLKEGKAVTFYVAGSFIHVSPDSLDESMISKTISSEEIKLYEMNDLFLFNTNRDFYNTVKAYEALGFSLTKNGVSAKLNKTQVDFKMNEANGLDLYVNSNLVTDANSAKANDTFIFENKETKMCLFNIFENLDSIYNMNFVKFILNEGKSAASMIVNLQDDYFVYDYLSEGKVDIYKLDAYKLYEFVLNKYGYDVSPLYKFQINNTLSKATELNEKKDSIMNAITKLEESIKKIDETLSAGIKSEDSKLLSELKSNITGEIDKLKSTYVTVCESMDVLLLSKKSLITENEDGGAQTEDASGDEGSVPAQDGDAQTEDTSEGLKKNSNSERIVENTQDIPQSQTQQPQTQEQSQDPQSGDDEVLEFIIPDWAASALVNGDVSGLTDEDEVKIDNFINDIAMKHGNAQFIPADDDELDLGFKHTNDIDELGANCIKLILIPSPINESILGNILGGISNYFGKVFKSAKIDAALKRYSTELPQVEKDKLTQELEIEIAKKSGADTTTAQKQFTLLQQKETAIRTELDAGIKEILAKRPDLKPMADKMRAQAEKGLLDSALASLEEFKTNGKYKDSQLIGQKITKIQQEEVKLDQFIKTIKDIKPGLSSDPNAFNTGDTVKYTDKNGTTTYYMLTNVVRSGEKVTQAQGKLVNDGANLVDLKTITQSGMPITLNVATITGKVIDPTEINTVYGNPQNMERYRLSIAPKTTPTAPVAPAPATPTSTTSPTPVATTATV